MREGGNEGGRERGRDGLKVFWNYSSPSSLHPHICHMKEEDEEEEEEEEEEGEM